MSKCGTLSLSWCAHEFNARKVCWQSWRLNSDCSWCANPAPTLGVVPRMSPVSIPGHRCLSIEGAWPWEINRVIIVSSPFPLPFPSWHSNSRFQKLFQARTWLSLSPYMKNSAFDKSVFCNEKLIALKHFLTSCSEDKVINICLPACFVSGVTGR